MLSQRQFLRRQRTQMFSQPPPTGGWNTRDEISDMDSRDAPYLENWFPDNTSVRVRNGCRFTASVSCPANFRTLIEYNDPEVSAMIVGSGGSITAYNDSTNTVLASGFVVNEWNGVNFGGQMILVNGFDHPQRIVYDGGFTCENASITGPATVSTLIDAHVFKSRVFYVEKGTADFWYTETDAIAGTLTRFPLSRVARGGGELLAIRSWTIDGGDGPDDYAVFFMSTGEVIAYQGTDPGRSGQWGLVGRYQLPELIGRRCIAQSAGKIYVITNKDLMILPDAFQQPTPPSSKLTGAISEAWADFSTLPGWQFTVFQTGGIALLNVPTGATTSKQFVINLKNGASTLYTGWNTFCFGIWDNRLFMNRYGTASLLRADYGMDDGFTANNTTAITCRAQLSPSNLGQQEYKEVKDYRLKLSFEGTATVSSGLCYDYNGRPDFYFPVTMQTLNTPWGSSWGSAWSAENFTHDDWFGASGQGTHVQLRSEIVASRQNLKWFRTDYRYTMAGQMN